MWFRRKPKGEKEEKEPDTIPLPQAREPLVPALRVFQYTEQGNRRYQQDSVYVSASGVIPLSSNKQVRILGAVCDGMGGMEDGGKASQTAIRMLREDFEKVRHDPRVSIPDFLLHEVRCIDDVIYHFSSRSGQGSGTTVAAAAVENDQLYWISAGDSRIYLLRQGRLEQKTRDHNYKLQLMQMGMTEEEAGAQKKSEALISFLGIGNIQLIDRNSVPFPMQMNDMLLLCSDGITKTLPDQQIREILLSPTSSADKKAQVLVQAAVRSNTHSQDNTSAVVIEYALENAKALKRMEGPR